MSIIANRLENEEGQQVGITRMDVHLPGQACEAERHPRLPGLRMGCMGIPATRTAPSPRATRLWRTRVARKAMAYSQGLHHRGWQPTYSRIATNALARADAWEAQATSWKYKAEKRLAAMNAADATSETLRGEKNELNEKLNEMSAALTNGENTMGDLRNEYEEKNVDLEKARNDIEELRYQVKTLEGEVEAGKQNIVQHENAIAKWEQGQGESNEKIEEFKEGVENLRAALKRKEEELTKAKAKADNLRDELKRKEEELTKANEKLATLTPNSTDVGHDIEMAERSGKRARNESGQTAIPELVELMGNMKAELMASMETEFAAAAKADLATAKADLALKRDLLLQKPRLLLQKRDCCCCKSPRSADCKSRDC